MSTRKPKPARDRKGPPAKPAAEKSAPATTKETAPKTGSEPAAKKKPTPPIACEASGGAPKTPKDRFYSGLIAGIAAAIMVVVILGGAAAQVAGGNSPFQWGSRETSSGPLLGLNAEGKGSVSGWMIPTGVMAPSTDDATTSPIPTVGTLAVYWPATEASITVTAELEFLVGRSATISREGKPWDPPGDKANSAAWRFLNQLYSEETTLGAEEHTMTVKVHRAEEGLIADSIDLGPALAQPEDEGLGEEEVIDLGAP